MYSVLMVGSVTVNHVEKICRQVSLIWSQKVITGPLSCDQLKASWHYKMCYPNLFLLLVVGMLSKIGNSHPTTMDLSNMLNLNCACTCLYICQWNHLQQIHNKLLKRHFQLWKATMFLLKLSNVRRHLMEFNLVSFKTKKNKNVFENDPLKNTPISNKYDRIHR